MTRLVLIDYSSRGHHISYAKNLLCGLKKDQYEVCLIGARDWVNSLANYADSIIVVPFNDSQSNILKSEFDKYNFINECMHRAREKLPDIVHIMYLDHFVSACYLNIRNEDFQVRYTLHWGYMLPEFSFGIFKKFKSFFERIFIKRLTFANGRFMLHSLALKHRFRKVIGRNVFDYVPYPIQELEVVDRDDARDFILGTTGILDSNICIILLFGDTRFDKGADIAVRALEYLPSNYHLLIAGNLDDLSRDQLESIPTKLGINNRLHFHSTYIPDSAIPSYFKGVDLVVIPYRKEFAGQSGPLTIAASVGTPVVASNLLVLSETVETYRLGRTFLPEDPEDLAQAILSLENSRFIPDIETFREDHSGSQFLHYVIQSYEGGSPTSTSTGERR